MSFSKHDGPSVSFPLSRDGAASLRQSNAVSPTLRHEAAVAVADFESVVSLPTHVGDKGFWRELEAVVDLQVARERGGAASDILDVPKIFTGYSLEQGAQAVRADWPIEFPTKLIQQFVREGAGVDPEIIPQRSRDDFTNGIVGLACVPGWAVDRVSPSCFAAKWDQGRARPEEVAKAIHDGALAAPGRLRDKIASLGMTSAESFTAYPEGCPRHPAWPAMHSAASCAATYLPVVMNLSKEQVAEARRLDYAVATFRSVAGVHYHTDNSAGLMIGQEVIRRELPDYIIERYWQDASPEKQAQVRAKIVEKLDRYHHDWTAHSPKANG